MNTTNAARAALAAARAAAAHVQSLPPGAAREAANDRALDLAMAASRACHEECVRTRKPRTRRVR